MIQLPTKYNKGGFDYNQVFRDDQVAIYEQISDGERIAYEVYEIVIAKEAEVFGKVMPEREVLPNSEKWGLRAFTVWTLEKAHEKAEKIRESIVARKIALQASRTAQI